MTALRTFTRLIGALLLTLAVSQLAFAAYYCWPGTDPTVMSLVLYPVNVLLNAWPALVLVFAAGLIALAFRHVERSRGVAS